LWTGPGNDEHSVAVKEIGAPDHHVLVKGGDAPRYSAKLGMLFYKRLGDLYAVTWRPSTIDLGRAVPVTMPERTNDNGNEGSGNYALSSSGTMAYVGGGRSRNAARLVWGDYENVMISPDGTKAIVQIREGMTTLWIYDFARNTLTPIGNSAGSCQSPVWTSDGSRIIYRGTRQGFRNAWWRSADGSGAEERLATKDDATQSPTSVSPDGHWLLFNANSA
jgi:hypothetical protein